MEALRALFRNIEIPLKGGYQKKLLNLYDAVYTLKTPNFLYFLALVIFTLPRYRYPLFILPSLFNIIYIFLDPLVVGSAITGLIRVNYGQIASETTKKSRNRSIRTMMYSIALVLWERRLIPEFVD